jgi:hypothetical protein
LGPTCHTLHLTYIPSHNFIHQYVSTHQTSFHRPTTIKTSFFCMRSKQRTKWRRGSQDGHQGWAPAHLPRAPALSPAPSIKSHLQFSFSSHTHFRKPCNLIVLSFQSIVLVEKRRESEEGEESVRRLRALLSKRARSLSQQ